MFRRVDTSISLTDLVFLAKHRWIIERDCEELKQELGLGHFEGRGWRGFHHHATLCIAAYGFLVAERSRFSPSARVGRLQLSLPAIPQSWKPRGSSAAHNRRATTGAGGTAMDISYMFHATQNNGRITARKNWMNGQEVQYQYDALNRLISASTVGAGGWGQSFTYDGFGNLWSQTPTKGTAPSIAVNLQMATNRINSYGYGYDGNGNTVSMPAVGGGTATMTFDVDNRMTSWTGGPGTEEYGYLADNKRVWKKDPSGVETYSFYGVGGQKLVTYMVASTFPFVLSSASWNVYFGGKLIRANGETVVADRLGSVVARQDVMGVGGPTRHDYFPYGAEMGWAAPGNKDKFGTYFRDATTGMDYADQRYFTGLQGRFLTVDPLEGSASSSKPGSWNRYLYVYGDPVNSSDRTGMIADGDANGCGAPMLPGDDNFGVSYCVATGDGAGAQGGSPVSSGAGGSGCILDGLSTDCTLVHAMASSGAAMTPTAYQNWWHSLHNPQPAEVVSSTIKFAGEGDDVPLSGAAQQVLGSVYGTTAALTTPTPYAAWATGAGATGGLLVLGGAYAGGGLYTLGDAQMPLFRAVQPGELAQIMKSGVFAQVANSTEFGKYFAATFSGASQYAQMAGRGFRETYTVVGTSIAFRWLPGTPPAVDRGIVTTIIPPNLLPMLTSPVVYGYINLIGKP